MYSLGSDLNKQMLGMSLVPNPTTGEPTSALKAQMLAYLEANGVDITKSIKKSLDTAHSIVSQRVAVGSSRLTFFEDIDPNENEHFVIFGMRVYDGTNATLDATAWTPGTAIGEVQNGQFDVLSNGVRVMKNHTFSDFTEAAEDSMSGWVMMPEPIIWEAQTEFQLNATFPAALATVNLNLQIEFFGWKLIG